MRALLAVPLLAAMLAGCLGGEPGTDGSGPPTSPPVEVPPGCDPGRPATVHHASGEATTNHTGPAPMPCLLRTGSSSFEPTLGVASDGTLFLYPAAFGGLAGRDPVAVARSRDGGVTWEEIFPTLGGQPTHRSTFDPYFYLDPVTDRIFADDLGPTASCSYVSFSDDLGETWTNTVAGCTTTDHQNLFAGPPVSSAPADYPNVVYRCAFTAGVALLTASGVTCEKSLTGGLTWASAGSPAYHADPTQTGHFHIPGYCTGGLGHGIVDHRGVVLLPNGWCGRPWLAISKDEGLTWTRTLVSDLRMPSTADGIFHDEAGVGVDAEGRIYYGWIAQDRMPYYAISEDDGATWGAPVRVNVPGLTETAMVEFVVGGPGRLAFAFFGSADSPGGPFETCADTASCLSAPPSGPDYGDVTWSGFIAMTVNALDLDPVFYTAAVNDPADPLIRGPCGPIGCQEAADFIDLRIGPDGTPWASFVDGCTGDCASGDTMEDNDGEGVLGRLWGGASLWGERDPNGPYP